jgi:glycosyltransferase involved in cell wall biosynthesis
VSGYALSAGTGIEPSWDVPVHEAQVFSPRRSRYVVLVFVLNEGERIRRQLAKMRTVAREHDVVVVDGGSTDGALSPEAVRDANVRALLVKTGPGQLSAQMRVGLAWALREGYEGVILIDGNDKDDPAAIRAFARALDVGFDHVQGSRFMPGGQAIRTPTARLLGIKLLHAPALSLAAGYRYTDTTNGFRAYSRRFLLDSRVAPFRDVFVGYELHYYLAIRAARLGFRVTEVPVTRAYPAGEKPPTKISPLRGNLRVLATLARACLNRFDP